MKLYTDYQKYNRDKRIPLSVFWFAVLFLSVFLSHYLTDGDFNTHGDVTLFFPQVLMYLILQGAINLIAWLVNRIRKMSYKPREYEILLLIPVFLFYNGVGLIFASVVTALTVFSYVLYLSPTEKKEK